MLRESLDGGHVKGGMLASHLAWLTENRPDVSIEAVRRRVSAETAQLVAIPVLPTRWYPFRVLVELDRGIARACEGDERAIALELGRYSARINLSTSYKVFRKARPQDFFRDQALLHGRFQDFGRACYEDRNGVGCVLKMVDYSCYSKVFCWSAVGFYTEAAAIHGAQAPRAVERDCVCEGAAACVFEVSWQGVS